MDKQAETALTMLEMYVVPTEDLYPIMNEVKGHLNGAVSKAKSRHPDKLGIALQILRGAYGLLKVIHAANPTAIIPGVTP